MKQKAIELRKQGLTYQAIADQLNLSLSTAYRYANVVVLPSDIERAKRQVEKEQEKKLIKKKKQDMKKQIAEREKKSIALRKKGLLYREVAERLGISITTARRDAHHVENIQGEDMIESTIHDGVMAKENERYFLVYDSNDEIIAEGTRQDIAKTLGVKYSTVCFYLTPSYEKRREKRGSGYFFVDVGTAEENYWSDDDV